LTLAAGAASAAEVATPQDVNTLAQSFVRPPESARPWVYWFWLNGNVTREGITADLESMRRVGIGGVLIMEVDQGAPVGPVGFMSDRWRELFGHVVAEAGRLGLEVNMNNDAGWNGSGGPWVKPELSMQKVVASRTEVAGPKHVEASLPRPKAVAGFYRDIAVLAFPTPGNYRIADIAIKAAYRVGGAPPIATQQLPREMVIRRERIVNLSPRMDGRGRLTWEVPAGRWTILRIGRTSTGMRNAPAPASGCGLECDKLSKEGIEAHFNAMMARLVDDVGPAAGKALAATHVDSWENGSQNWTARMREQFQARRGYDLLPFLPVMTGRVVDSLEISERFLWDLRRTVSELVVENYAGHLRELAHRHGLRFTIEAYGSPCDNLPYACQCDEPMGEFWIGGGSIESCRGMASAAHLSGKSIVGAESFTADDHERWRDHPATIKALGDWAFTEGINRFVFHRFAMQPWLDRRPGMTMGPWGTHFERTQTWWELTPGWHQYLARCQFLLRQGTFAADLCYLTAEDSPQGMPGHPQRGYGWDQCSPEIVLSNMTVQDGRLALPSGMSYRLLVLSDARRMTPALLKKIRRLIEAGATVVGPRPLASPSLNNYPRCDDEVQRLAAEVWANCDGQTVQEHRLGLGRIVWGPTPEQVLERAGVRPDFSGRPLRYIHRRAKDLDIYFVANPLGQRVSATPTFRVSGKTPELWWPDSGRTEPAALFRSHDGLTQISFALEPHGSVFVVFRDTPAVDAAVDLSLNGLPLVFPSKPTAKITIDRAVYGVLDDPKRTRDVRRQVQSLVDRGIDDFQVASLAVEGDPAFGIVKTLIIEYTVAGKHLTVTGTDPENVILTTFAASDRVAELAREPDGQLRLDAWQPGQYAVKLASGQTRQATVAQLPPPLELAGPWDVSFPPESGLGQPLRLPRLVSWTERPELGVKYFSGTAAYRAVFQVPAESLGEGRRLWLDLGDVQAFAQVKLNGKQLGLLWKPPYGLDVTGVLTPGQNSLDVSVTNLWPNRMIGDEQLPEDSQRNLNGTLRAWPDWLEQGKPSPTGRQTFTTWRLWKKGDALLKSGLLGPVRLIPFQSVVLPK
jgi:hypothetical protein